MMDLHLEPPEEPEGPEVNDDTIGDLIEAKMAWLKANDRIEIELVELLERFYKDVLCNYEEFHNDYIEFVETPRNREQDSDMAEWADEIERSRCT